MLACGSHFLGEGLAAANKHKLIKREAPKKKTTYGRKHHKWSGEKHCYFFFFGAGLAFGAAFALQPVLQAIRQPSLLKKIGFRLFSLMVNYYLQESVVKRFSEDITDFPFPGNPSHTKLGWSRVPFSFQQSASDQRQYGLDFSSKMGRNEVFGSSKAEREIFMGRSNCCFYS